MKKAIKQRNKNAYVIAIVVMIGAVDGFLGSEEVSLAQVIALMFGINLFILRIPIRWIISLAVGMVIGGLPMLIPALMGMSLSSMPMDWMALKHILFQGFITPTFFLIGVVISIFFSQLRKGFFHPKG